MNAREKFMLKAALLYAQANLDDLNQAFELEEAEVETSSAISVDQERGEMITETEIEQLLSSLQ